MPIEQSAVRNQLLRLLSPEDFALLAPHLSPCHAAKGDILFRRDEKIETVWFIDSGVGSLITISPQGQRAESGLFGRDGFAPVPLVMGSDRANYDGVIQIRDDCHNMPADAFIDAIGRSRTLHDLLLRYAHALAVQTAYTALSNAVHPIDERLARWILMCHDRMDGDEMPLTHEFMAIMLAVRRPSVTSALHVLEGNRFIRAQRGCIVVRDRAALVEFAGDAYGPPEAEYERLIGPLRR
jgi:CRP-like cAMP-binding protein